MSEMKKCCLCYKEINERIEQHNPDPIRREDDDGTWAACCSICNSKYVIPARLEVWHGFGNGLTKEESDILIERIQHTDIEDIKNAIEQDKLIELLRK